MHVVVQVFALAEPHLERTLDAYAACDVPTFVSTIRYEACVTPRSSVTASATASLDEPAVATLRELLGRNVTAARRHADFELVETPPGKLTSRNYAHDAASRAGADAIVVGDGDASPVDASYLERLLAPVATGGAVGANGFSRPATLGGWLVQPARRLDLALRRPLYGRSSAISTAGWEAAGPFRVDTVDPTEVVSVRREEEFAFRRRLESVGPVVDVDEARVYNDNRRYACSLDRGFNRFGRPMTGYCKRIGIESFQPVSKGDQ
jgi:hypothetical protein